MLIKVKYFNQQQYSPYLSTKSNHIQKIMFLINYTIDLNEIIKTFNNKHITFIKYLSDLVNNKTSTIIDSNNMETGKIWFK